MELTIPAVVRRAAREFGEATALYDPLADPVTPGGLRLSYRSVGEQAERVAASLISAGLDPGDRVAVWGPNDHHWVLAALGALTAGGVLVPVSTRFTGPEALDVIGRSGARALFVAGNFLGVDRLGALREAASADGGGLDRLGLVVRMPEDWAAFSRASIPGSLVQARRRAAEVRPGDVSDIMFTSGTTGRSKGAMTSHERSLGVARAWAECAGLGPADRYLVVNPFFHTFGFKAGILACLVSGAALVPQAVFDAGEAMRLVQAERITVFPGAPTIYVSILDHPGRHAFDLSSLRLAVTGAADVPVALVERMRHELSFETVLTAYGLTEAVVATMCRPGDAAEIVAATSGRAAAGFEVQIASDGEILLRGPNMMLGYLDDPDATKAAIDGDGWLHTGDAGRLDAAGYLTITGRIKDMYICGGFNVYPAEVEQVLARLEGVAESAVVGVPDPRLGEVGKAYLVTRPGQVLAEADVLAFCRERLANYKVPRVVEFRDNLPRNPSGKVLKRVLRAPGGDAPPKGGTLMADEVLYAVRGHVALITLNRPQYANAQNSAMTYALDAAFARAVNDDGVAVIVLAGAGKHFCAGHDIGTPERDADQSFDREAVLWWDHVGKEGADARYAREMEVYLGMCRRWREIPKPLIAMVHGACIAGGLMLAWVCDLIVAADDAFFADPVVKMGIPGVEYFAHPWVLGPRFAKEVLFTGGRFSAERAYQVGMVSQVVPRAELESATFELAGKVAEMPRFGLALAKRAVNQCEDLMGMRPGMDSVFGLHHMAHAHNAEVSGHSLAGLDARGMKASG